MRALLIGAAMAAGACGGGGGPTITVEMIDPVLVAIDRGDGWERLPVQWQLEVEVSGPFALVGVCDGALSGIAVDVQLATPEDLPVAAIRCWSPTRWPDLAVRLDSYAPPEARTRVSVGAAQSVVVKEEPQTLDVLAGLTDRLAVEEYGTRFLLDRDVDLGVSEDWVVRMERDGIPLDEIPIEIPPELVSIDLEVDTEITMNRVALTILGDTQPTTVQALPADVLRPTDTQRVVVKHVVDARRTRTFAATPGVAPVVVRFPESIGGINLDWSGGVPAATWGDGGGPWLWRRFSVTDIGPGETGGNTWWLTAHPGWTELLGEERSIRFPVLDEIPGFDPYWNLSDYFGRLVLGSDPRAAESVGWEHSMQVGTPSP